MSSGGVTGSGVQNVLGWLHKLQELPNDSPAKTLIVALTVSLVGSVLVSTTAVLLRPLQLANKERERQQYLLEIVMRLPGIQELFESVKAEHVETQMVDLATGNYVRSLDPTAYDQRKAAQDPRQSIELPPERDLARIKRRAKVAPVYLVRKDDRLALIILPVYGRGFASTLYGYLGLAADANTVVGLNFYEHGETPGLGGQVNSLAWRHRWRGKKVLDEEGALRIGIAKRRVEATAPNALYEVDGLSGATWTSRGVHNLLRFWLGEDGFGPYLQRIRSQ